MREVWIEIWIRIPIYSYSQSLPVREVWIEILTWMDMRFLVTSLPVREVWIEIVTAFFMSVTAFVTSREGSVD